MDENPPHGPEEVYSVYNFPHSPFVDIKEVKTVSTRYLRMCGGWSGEWRRMKRNIHTHSKTNTNLSDSTYFCLTFFFWVKSHKFAPISISSKCQSASRRGCNLTTVEPRWKKKQEQPNLRAFGHVPEHSFWTCSHATASSRGRVAMWREKRSNSLTELHR